MTKFTKEQLIDQAREEVAFWRERDELIPSQQTAIRLRLAEITLAALTAEPAYFINRVKHSDAYGDDVELRAYCYELDAMNSKEDFGGEIVAVFTAPPAPVSVPTFEEWCERNEQKPLGWVRDAMKEAYEGCRSAMLQGAEPVQRWIPCSERMPDFDTRVILYFPDYGGHIEDGCIGDEGDGPYHYFFDGDSLRHEPTHWMPLPATPQ